MKTKLLLLLSCLLLQLSGRAQQSLDYRVDSLFKTYLDSGLAGSVIVVKEGRVILKKAYGFANNETKTLNTTATLFNVASIGKQFTMFAVLQLERKGLLHTNDLLSKYIGSFNDMRDSITIHHLLCHTSGIVKSGDSLDYSTRSNFIQSMKAAEAESKPGIAHRYSNAGYSMLAVVVEIVSGMPFENYLRKNIFQPLDMQHTGYPWEAHTDKKLLATGYNNKREPMPVQNDIWAARGPGNLVTTMEDLYQWMQAYENKDFISPEIKNKILYDYLPGKDTYAWNKAMTGHNTRFYHKGGGRPDFESRMMWYPDDKVLIIFSLNNDYNLARKLFTAINGFMH